MLLDNSAANGQAKAGAALFPHIGGVYLPKAVEYAFQRLGGYSPALVGDMEFGFTFQDIRTDENSAPSLRKFNRIRDEVREHLCSDAAKSIL